MSLLRALARLYRSKLPEPIDVPNLLTYADEGAYRWYALAVGPVLALNRGSLRWAGRHVAALHGERLSDSLLIVRYPSHRHFVRMLLTPYYLLVANPIRERAVARFEASFTSPEATFPDLHHERVLLALGHDSDLPEVEAALERAGGHRAYATRVVSKILGPPRRPADARPLRFSRLSLWAFADEAQARDVMSPELTAGLEAARATLQLYLRKARREMFPKMPSFRD
jgi:hypothetical protein